VFDLVILYGGVKNITADRYVVWAFLGKDVIRVKVHVKKQWSMTVYISKHV